MLLKFGSSLLPLTFAACSAGPSQTAEIPTVIASAPPQTRASVAALPPAPPLLAACDRLAHLQEEAAAAAPDGPHHLQARLRELARDLPPCATFAGGAWGFVLHSPRYECSSTKDCDDSDDFADSVHAAADLVVALASGETLRRAAYEIELGGFASNRLEASLFDYEGDGRPELLVEDAHHVHESRGSIVGTIWTFAATGIEPYAPSRGFDFRGAVDIDKDGRPDLDLGPVYEGDIVPCGLDGVFIEVGTHRFAHSTKGGGFSVDDDAVKAAFQDDCKAPPKKLVPRVKGGVDNDALRHNVVCARVWGKSTKDVVDMLTKDCRPPPATVDACAFEGVIPGCVNLPLLKRWAEVTPPVTLQLPKN